MRVGVCVPTLNAGGAWEDGLKRIITAGEVVARFLVIDSDSADGTPDRARAANFEVLQIRRQDFNHGRTRQLAIDYLSDCEIVVFLTQDAIIAEPDSIRNLLEPFSDPRVGAAYGRQLPHADAGIVGSHARLFNYPDRSEVRDQGDIPRLGIKAAFISNSFAAYRRDALNQVGGFPENTIFAEDMIAAAKMLLAGWKVAYQSDALVYHSHDYTFLEEFRRYFDIGAMHAREPWLLERFGRPEGEGKRYVRSELRYVAMRAPSLIPSVMLRTALKLLGYRLGLRESKLSVRTKRALSMHTRYWDMAAQDADPRKHPA